MKKALLPLALAVISTAHAKVEIIPKHLRDLEAIRTMRQGFVLKSAKNDILQAHKAVTPDNWFNLSPADGSEGISSEAAYAAFGIPTAPQEVIVAVIDSGVDVNHEDLQGKVWINADEIANDGVDNDDNGYVDDVFGWNFIGGANGMATIETDATLGNGIRLVKGNPDAQIEADTLEITREVVRLRTLRARLQEVGGDLPAEQAALLARIEAEVTRERESARATLNRVLELEARLNAGIAVLRAAGLSDITLESVRSFQTTDATVAAARTSVLQLLAQGLDSARLTRLVAAYGSRSEFYYNTEFNPRTRVGDNYADQNERVYGNNDVIGPDSSHGTHVAGIIAADRANELGIKGVATQVKIMAVRVVPDGDERDKDVANGIRYAVDNGAKIINMSFGKAFSPYKRVVDEAVRYAESKGVLLVHAAGNSNQNNDTAANFPNRRIGGGNTQATNWLEIGASSFERGETLPADFSNYGKNSVDIFAPGVDILSTTPDNTYATFSGTSMASPTAAGAAALLWSYGPDLPMAEVRSLLVDTGRRYPRLRVNTPEGVPARTLFSDLSVTGSIVDVRQAVEALNAARR